MESHAGTSIPDVQGDLYSICSQKSLAQTIFYEGAGCLILPTLSTYILEIYNEMEFTPMK